LGFPRFTARLEQIRQEPKQKIPAGVALAEASYGNALFRQAITELGLPFRVDIELVF
jgi:hypothetical protein